MNQTHEGLPGKEVALTFRTWFDVLTARDVSFPDFDTICVGDKTLIVPAEELKRYKLLHPVVNEVLDAIELPQHGEALLPREQIIFEASAE